MKKQAYEQEERLLEYTEIDVKCSVLDICFSFDVGRSFFKTIPYGINIKDSITPCSKETFLD
jgi:hypothetical protein